MMKATSLLLCSVISIKLSCVFMLHILYNICKILQYYYHITVCNKRLVIIFTFNIRREICSMAIWQIIVKPYMLENNVRQRTINSTALECVLRHLLCEQNCSNKAKA